MSATRTQDVITSPWLDTPPVPILSFFVPGTPRPQGSKNRGRNGQSYEASKYLKEWRKYVYSVAYEASWGKAEIAGPVILECVFTFKRPQAHYLRGNLRDTAPRYHTGKPDLSKLLRAIEDSLTEAGVWSDDSQVVGYGATRKVYGEEPGVLVAVRCA